MSCTGTASQNGDRARGARYNSGVRYVELAARNHQTCLVVIVSEDGYVDILPQLPMAPQAEADVNHDGGNGGDDGHSNDDESSSNDDGGGGTDDDNEEDCAPSKKARHRYTTNPP